MKKMYIIYIRQLYCGTTLIFPQILEWKRINTKWENKRRLCYVAFCINSSGTHKLPLFFVIKYGTSQLVKHIDSSI